MNVYTFWCEYDLGINDEIYETETALRNAVIKELSYSDLEESLEELESEGLFYIRVKEIK